MAQSFSSHIAPYLGQDCDPNKIPIWHVRSALARAIDDGKQFLSVIERRNKAAVKELSCSQAALDRDKSAMGKPYADKKAIEAAYSYMYGGKCTFTPITPSF